MLYSITCSEFETKLVVTQSYKIHNSDYYVDP